MNKFNIGAEVQLRGKKGAIIEIVYNDNECGKYIEYKFLDELGEVNYGTEDDLQPIDTQEDIPNKFTSTHDVCYICKAEKDKNNHRVYLDIDDKVYCSKCSPLTVIEPTQCWVFNSKVDM